MEGNILLKNATLATRDRQGLFDILISGGRIRRIAPEGEIKEGAEKEINLGGKFLTYGLADVHVHFREPGYSYKETIRTGSLAGANGGYTCVCTMPNLNPSPDTPGTIAIEQDIIDRDAVIDVRPYATITKGRKGLETVDVKALKSLCVGFSDDGSGVQNDSVMRCSMREIALNGCILAAHCEDNSLLHGGYIHDGKYAAEHGHKGICSESEWGQIARDIRLAKETGCAYHVCHISTKESVEIIRKAKADGVDVTCETAPHYLVLTQDNLCEDARYKMNPPLRDKADREALLEGIADGTIDMIATDHAPHSEEEKSRGLSRSAMGVVGLETAFPVLYTKLVRTGVISLRKLVELMCVNPRKRFRLGGELKEGESADLSVFDLDCRYVIDSSRFLSMGRSTPFDGMEVYGKHVMTIFKGNIL